MEAAVRSLLNRCSGTDALHLTTLCRVPVRQLARCVRTLEVTNFTLIRFLNQFAERTVGNPKGASVSLRTGSW